MVKAEIEKVNNRISVWHPNTVMAEQRDILYRYVMVQSALETKKGSFYMTEGECPF